MIDGGDNDDDLGLLTVWLWATYYAVPQRLLGMSQLGASSSFRVTVQSCCFILFRVHFSWQFQIYSETLVRY